MAAATVLDCRIREILLADAVWRSRPIAVPNFVKICRSVTEILQFFEFLRWSPPPSWIFEIAKFYWLCGGEGRGASACQISSKLFFLLRRYCNFQIFKMAAAAILDFWNREILLVISVQRVETHLCAKFCHNRWIGCEDIKIFRFFKMAAVHHIGFVWGIFGPPTVSTCGSLSLCKIWLWSMQ